MAQFQTGHSQHLVRAGRHLSPHMGDQIEGRHMQPPKVEPVLTRQKHPPLSVRDAKPAVVDKPDKTTVKCRQIIKGGHAQIVPLTKARTKFQSNMAKCQGCQHRMQCATA